jgi:predicted PurR-regulated permease PerM
MFSLKEREIKTGIMLLMAGGIIYFLFSLGTVLIPFLAGIILAYLLYPLLDFLRKRNISKSSSLYIISILFLVTIIAFSVLVVPVFLNELELLTKNIPEYIRTADKYIDFLNSEYRRINMPAAVKEVIDRTLKRVEEQLITFMEGITERLINSLGILFSLMIAPFITYYILVDLDKLKKGVIRYIPAGKRRLILSVSKEINSIFSGYLRGQFWVSIIVGIMSSIGLFIFQIRFYILLGFFAGIFNMIPFAGPVIGSIPAVIITLLSTPEKTISVIIMFFVIQQLESSFISPRIISGKVGLHPLVVIFSLLTGAEIMGIWGMLLAVPAAGCIKVFAELFMKNKLS